MVICSNKRPLRIRGGHLLQIFALGVGAYSGNGCLIGHLRYANNKIESLKIKI